MLFHFSARKCHLPPFSYGFKQYVKSMPDILHADVLSAWLRLMLPVPAGRITEMQTVVLFVSCRLF